MTAASRWRPFLAHVAVALALAACGAPADPPSGTAAAVPAGGAEQRVWCTGEAARVVLLHGIGDDASSQAWLGVQDALGPEVASCRYDRPGAGQSPPPPASGRRTEDLLTELDAVVDHAGGDLPVVLVAHSFGGYLARLYADASPDRVAGVVFVDALDPSVGLVAGTGAGDLDAVAMADEALDLATIEADAAAVTRLPGAPPVVVLARGEDVSEAWTAGQRALLELSPDAALEVVDGAGHQIPLDAPEAVAAAVRDVLAGVGATG